MDSEVRELVVGDRESEAKSQELTDPARRRRRRGESGGDGTGYDRRRAVGDLDALARANEEVPQVRGEPGRVDRVRVEVWRAGLPHDGHDLAQDPRLLDGLMRRSRTDRGREEVERERRGLASRETDARARGAGGVELVDHPLGETELLGVEVCHLGAQGIVHLQTLACALDHLVDVVNHRDDGGRGHARAQVAEGRAEDPLDESDALKRDTGNHLADGLRRLRGDVATRPPCARASSGTPRPDL